MPYSPLPDKYIRLDKQNCTKGKTIQCGNACRKPENCKSKTGGQYKGLLAQKRAAMKAQRQREQDPRTLEELFLEADRIGNKYQTPEERQAFQKKLSKEVGAIADIVDRQLPEQGGEAIDFSKGGRSMGTPGATGQRKPVAMSEKSKRSMGSTLEKFGLKRKPPVGTAPPVPEPIESTPKPKSKAIELSNLRNAIAETEAMIKAKKDQEGTPLDKNTIAAMRRAVVYQRAHLQRLGGDEKAAKGKGKKSQEGLSEVEKKMGIELDFKGRRTFKGLSIDSMLPDEYIRANRSDAKATPAQADKVSKVMKEWKSGELNVGKSKKKVKSRKQAIAIALSEAGLSKTDSIASDPYIRLDKGECTPGKTVRCGNVCRKPENCKKGKPGSERVKAIGKEELTKYAQAQKAKREPKAIEKKAEPKNFLEGLRDNQRENLFATMRSIDAEGNRALEKHNKLRPRYGTAGVGASDMDEFFKSEASREFLSGLRRGKSPEEARDTAKEATRSAIESWNAKGAKTRVAISNKAENQRWANSLDDTIDGYYRRVKKAIESPASGTKPQSAPVATSEMKKARSTSIKKPKLTPPKTIEPAKPEPYQPESNLTAGQRDHLNKIMQNTEPVKGQLGLFGGEEKPKAAKKERSTGESGRSKAWEELAAKVATEKPDRTGFTKTQKAYVAGQVLKAMDTGDVVPVEGLKSEGIKALSSIRSELSGVGKKGASKPNSAGMYSIYLGRDGEDISGIKQLEKAGLGRASRSQKGWIDVTPEHKQLIDRMTKANDNPIELNIPGGGQYKIPRTKNAINNFLKGMNIKPDDIKKTAIKVDSSTDSWGLDLLRQWWNDRLSLDLSTCYALRTV